MKKNPKSQDFQPANGTADDTDKPEKPQRFFRKLFSFFFKNLNSNQKLSQTRKAIVLNDLIESSTPNNDFFVLVFLSCAIATFGLIINSAAVIIGAMLVAPLMSPIMSLSMASISGLGRLFRQSIIAIIEGFGLSIVLSSLLAFLTYRLPLGALATVTNEVLSRSSPSLIDLLIALAGGAAAAYALVHPKLSAALPGVAISTALMPPICTIGIGVALLRPNIILGALLLFITNLTAITFSGMLTFALMGFRPRKAKDNEKVSQNVSISLILVMAISIPLGVFAINSLNEARIFNLTRNAIIESASPYAQAILVELNIATEGETREINAVLRTSRELSHSEVVSMQSDIADRLQKPVRLQLVTVPMQLLDPLNPPTPTPTVTPTPFLTATATSAPTFTPAPSATPAPSPTPLPAFIAAQSGINVYDKPEGSILFELPVNAAVRVNTQSIKKINDTVWVEIRDSFERGGWIDASGLDIQLDPESSP